MTIVDLNHRRNHGSHLLKILTSLKSDFTFNVSTLIIMAYRTRTSAILEKAQKRNLAIQSIDPNLNMGEGVSVAEFSASIAETQAKVDRYNLAISTLTQLHGEMMASEKALANQHERMLNSVSGKFGRDSVQYEMAGGRKRLGKRKTKATSPDPMIEMPLVTLPLTSTQQGTTESRSMNAVMN
jgi:hypothetical protein